MVKNILAAFDDRVDTLAWMTPATRAKAKEKIATLRVSVGYPETWRNYSTLDIRADDPLGNHDRARRNWNTNISSPSWASRSIAANGG